MSTKKRPVWEMVGAYPLCSACRSRKVARDAWACWSMAARDWELKAIFDRFVCEACGTEGTPEWAQDEGFRKARIRRLNDALRRCPTENATIVITIGVQALGEAQVGEICRKLSAFDEFSADNDPHGEHDFGAFEVCGEKIFFKIDYFDLQMQQHSPDAADPAVTHRVLTIMLASEY